MAVVGVAAVMEVVVVGVGVRGAIGRGQDLGPDLGLGPRLGRDRGPEGGRSWLFRVVGVVVFVIVAVAVGVVGVCWCCGGGSCCFGRLKSRQQLRTLGVVNFKEVSRGGRGGEGGVRF